MSVADVDAVLPQTQCRQCGFDGCRPYATAIVEGRAEINQCPPGGDAGIARLAAVVGRPTLPLNTTHGVSKPLALAWIDESLCIGCTLCIKACPVDAIVGGAKRMHDVVAELCTGCELCLPPCPVDCIVLVPAGHEWNDALAAAARVRHDTRAARLARLGTKTGSPAPRAAVADDAARFRKRMILDAAIERARRQRLDPSRTGRA
jgi:electron transport complex protein RnfB